MDLVGVEGMVVMLLMVVGVAYDDPLKWPIVSLPQPPLSTPTKNHHKVSRVIPINIRKRKKMKGKKKKQRKCIFNC